jgi:hypothetical protein
VQHRRTDEAREHPVLGPGLRAINAGEKLNTGAFWNRHAGGPSRVRDSI